MSYSGSKEFGSHNSVTVAIRGGDYQTIKEALVFVASVATTANRWVVFVFPGDYTEANPLYIPDYVTLIARGVHESTRISFTDPNQHGFICGADSDIIGIQAKNITGAGKAGFYIPVGKHEVEFHDCKTRDCDIGWLNEATGGTNILIRACSITGGTGTSIVVSKAGCTTVVQGFITVGTTNITGSAFFADGVNARLQVSSSVLESSGAIAIGYEAANGGFTHLAACTSGLLTLGMKIGTLSSKINALSSDFVFCTNDAELIDATSRLEVSGVRIASEKIIGISLGTIKGNFTSDTLGDEGVGIFGEFHVGTKEVGAESTLGGGDSYFWGVHTFTNTNLEVGVWADHTAAAQSSSGSTFAGFAGIGIGNCLYIGSAYAFPGIKQKTTVAQVLGGGALVLEYWNGGVWVELEHMSTGGNAPYSQYASTVFERVNSEQVRFRYPQPGWAMKLLNGETKYWIRFRIASAITSVPVIEQFKCHTHRMEVNADGYVEYFGAAQPDFPYPFGLRLLTELNDFTLGNDDLRYSANIRLNSIDNRLANGAKDGTGGSFILLGGTSTQESLVFDLYASSADNAPGDIEIELISAKLLPGDALDSTAIETSQKVVVGTGGARVPVKFSFNVDIHDSIPGDTIAFALIRNASGTRVADTLPSNVTIEKIVINGTRWKA